jgi:hypothetical protein
MAEKKCGVLHGVKGSFIRTTHSFCFVSGECWAVGTKETAGRIWSQMGFRQKETRYESGLENSAFEVSGTKQEFNKFNFLSLARLPPTVTDAHQRTPLLYKLHNESEFGSWGFL